MPRKIICPTGVDNDRKSEAFDDVDKGSVRSSNTRSKEIGKGARSENASEAFSIGATSQTSLTQMATLDLHYRFKCMQAWVNTKVSYRLFLMLLVPFVALTILLVIAINQTQSQSRLAEQVITLADLTSVALMTVAQLSAEFTSSLWWLSDESLSSGITWTSGGLVGTGLGGQYAITDTRITGFREYSTSGMLNNIDSRLAQNIAVPAHKLTGIADIRHEVRMFRATESSLQDFYGPLIDYLLNSVEVIALLSNSEVIRDSQALVSWSRTKIGLEKERHILAVNVLLKRRFGLDAFAEWENQLAIQKNWMARFLALAPPFMKDPAMEFLKGSVYRQIQEMRLQFLNSFDPENNASLPNVTFADWMRTTTTMVDFMRDVRMVATNAITGIATDLSNKNQMTQSLYIVLAVLSASFSVVIALAVGWSIHAPWNSLLRMRERMLTILREQDKRDKIVANFVPTDFLNMMGLKDIFELQCGTCMLKRATILSSEIRNFSKLSERMAPQQTFQFLSIWLQDSGPIIRRHGGFIEKFRGNSITTIFADPNDALDAGLELLEMTATRNKEVGNASLQLEIGIAIHTGDLMMGTVGDQNRMETTIISEALAIAIQVSNLTSAYNACMLLSKETFMVLNVEGLSTRFLGECGRPGQQIHPHVYEVLRPCDEGKLDSLNEFNQAIKMHQNGEHEQAVALYQSVLEIDPSDVVAARRLELAQHHQWVDVTSS